MSVTGGPPNPGRRETNAQEPSALQRAVAALEKMKGRLDAIDRAVHEPIAIVGIGCRFPGGADNPARYWEIIERGTDAVREIPSNRWPEDTFPKDRPETRWAALLDDLTRFDPAFFEISPREAVSLDPQQRLLLELTWEALEDAGIRADSLVGSKTAVYVGICMNDYLHGVVREGVSSVDTYSATGNLASTAAGRLSYWLGLQGPCASIDTACSSSLVAIDLACQSLRQKTSDLALVGGVNAILSPITMMLMSRVGALSADGRCKTFDARANGYVRGEGAGIVALKRLSDARRDGDRIRALILASAVNQDGRSTGLTTPNVLSQQALLRDALEKSRVAAEEIGYIETHGTGTPLGDPIEIEALKEVYGKPRKNEYPCFLGAVKTNIGHLEGAAGVAGLIKAVLCFEQEAIPKNLHQRSINPRIDITGTPFVIPREKTPWKRGKFPRRAGISSFGISGTNAHVIVEEAPLDDTPRPSPPHSAYLLPLSAKSTDALQAVAKAYAHYFSTNQQSDLNDIVYTASLRRTHHPHRLAMVATSAARFEQQCSDVARGETPASAIQGRTNLERPPRIAFVFSGQGSQWAGMGKSLLEHNAIFRAKIEEIDAIVAKYAPISILREITAEESDSRLGNTEIAQPCLFALQVAITDVLKSFGITPQAVIGHSVGEIAAAHISGALALHDAVRLVLVRGRIMQKATGNGKMVWVSMTHEDAQRAIAGFEDDIAIGAINDPSSTVLSGAIAAVDGVVASIERHGIATRPLRVNYAFHSPQMNELAKEFVETLDTLDSQPPQLEMYSTTLGAKVQKEKLDPNYWGRNIRATVNFAAAIQRALEDDYNAFVEIGPHPVLLANLQNCAAGQTKPIQFTPSLRRQVDGYQALLETLGALYVIGASVIWAKVSPANGRVVSLPSYPWQKTPYWIEAITPRAEVVPPAAISLDDWLFTLEWHLETQNQSPQSAPSTPGDWLIFMDSGRIGKNVVLQLKNKGVAYIRVDPGTSYEQLSPYHYRINAETPEDYKRLLQDAFGNDRICRGAIYLGNLDAPTWDETTVDALQISRKEGLLPAIYLTRALVHQAMPTKPRLWLITQGAVAVKPGDPVRSMAQASLWGLGRTIMVEHPELRCTCLDLDVTIKFDTVTNLIRQFYAEDNEEQIALRSNGRFVGRFAQTQLDQAANVNFEFKTNASYLITGGLGGLGLSIAQWMIDKGARHLALMARRKPSNETLEILKKMRATGAQILTLQGDVAHPDDVLQAMCAINAEMPELKGIVHAAGVVDDRILLEQSAEHWETVFAPKVDGAWNLHTLTLNEKLDFFVLYSSAASLFGSLGQANYAAANAFLDGLAQARHSRGLVAMSIQWGPFAEVGMAAAHDKRGNRMANQGMGSLLPDDGLQLISKLLERPRPDIGAMRLDVRKWFASFPELGKRASWSKLAATITNAKDADIAKEKQAAAIASITEKRLTDDILRAPLVERPKMIEDEVRRLAGLVLRMEPSKIGRDEKFQTFGFDSLMAIELRNRLQTSFDNQVSVADIWSHGSVEELTTWFGGKFQAPPPIALPTEPAKPAPAVIAPAVIKADSPGNWIVIPRPSPKAKMRLICFPYAGGGAPVYSSWPDSLPLDIEVVAIQPPGRLARINEPLAKTMDEMVNAIVPALLPYLNRPFATFGHCLGAIVMYEVVHRLASEHWTYPLQLFASGAPPPKQYLLPNLLNRSDSEFLGLLRAIGLTDQDVLNDPDLIRALLPMVRSDFQIAGNYRYRARAPLDMPIVTFAGYADAFAPPLIVNGWRQETTEYFAHHNYSGGHYFLVPERDSILRIIALEMAHRSAALQHQQNRRNAVVRLTNSGGNAPKIIRVICFPGLGGAAADFQALASSLPANVDVCAVEMPGHGTLMNQLPLGQVEDLSTQATNTISDLLDLPIVFVGHDLGALVMYETVLRLGRTRKIKPKMLVVLGAMGPSLHYFAPIHEAPAKNLTQILQLFDVHFDDKRATLEAVQADCAAMAKYSPRSHDPLDVAIAAFAAAKDGLIAPASVEAWQRQTTTQYELQRVDCNHADLLTSPSALEFVKMKIESIGATSRR